MEDMKRFGVIWLCLLMVSSATLGTFVSMLGTTQDPTPIIDHLSNDSTRGILDPNWGDVNTNTAICTESGDQINTQLVPDGQGGAIITWVDLRGGALNRDVYAQRVNASGVVQWTANGVAICATGSQGSPHLISDGQGGAIIVWPDSRSGGTNLDIYAQRVNSNGVVQWTASGVAICTAADNQGSPQLMPDGQGGAIIAWMDTRRIGSDFDIYAQRVNSSGDVQWAVDGVIICTEDGLRYYPQLVPDGQGGAIITWYDGRSFLSSRYDIYAQRVNASGVVQWTANGVAICTAPENQIYPQITTDGQGGAIITWHDWRNDSDYDIYAQRVNLTGVVQWAVNGVDICIMSGFQENPKLVPDGQGGAIISWEDYRNGIDCDIFAQRINASGDIHWVSNGVIICNETGDQSSPTLVPDGQGGAIITWHDWRPGSNSDVYAQRVNLNGVPLWEKNGLPVCTNGFNQQNAQITIDSRWLSGNQQRQASEQSNTANEYKGIVVVWQDNRGGNFDIYAQGINEDGKEFVEQYGLDICWGDAITNTAICTSASYQTFPALIPDGQGGVIITWEDRRLGFTRDIFAQRVNASGSAQWTANGVPICTANINQYNPKIISDGQGGAIIMWEDWRSSGDIYAQRVDASGSVLWTDNGVAICNEVGQQRDPQIIPDGQGGAIIAWHDNRVGGNYDVYAQRISSSGSILWTANGVVISNANRDQLDSQLAPDGQGGAIIVWQDYKPLISDIYAQRVNESGTAQWTVNGVVICAAVNQQYSPQIVPDGQGGAIIVWEDARISQLDIFAQRVNALGSVQWTANGVAIATGNTIPQWEPQITPDGQGGALIVWKDRRDGVNYNIYIQRVNAYGSVLWTTNGIALCSAANNQENPEIIPDGQGGAIVVWEDEQSNVDVYAQRVNTSGIVLWTTDGLAICTAINNQENPQITLDGQGGAIIVWSDYRTGSNDIYAQRIRLTQSTVVINEVMFDPSSGNDWVELHNPTNVSYDLNGWELYDSSETVIYTYGAVNLLSGSYDVQEVSTNLDNTDFLVLKDSDGNIRDILAWGGEPSGTLYENVVKSENWPNGNDMYIDTAGFVQGNTLGRDKDSFDTNCKWNWEITCGINANTPSPNAQNILWSIPLMEGWNLISMPLIQSEESIDKVLENITGKWDYIQVYNTTDPDHWKTNATFKPDQLNDLKLLNHKIGFWINITEPNVNLTVSGLIPISTTIPLYAGWNLIGYPTLVEKSITDSLVGTGYDRPVEGFNATAPYRISQFADSYMMKPGEGYWIHVPFDTVWTVDW